MFNWYLKMKKRCKALCWPLESGNYNRILHHANVGKQSQRANAETAPMRNPEHYQYELDLAEIAEVWRRGSVVAS